MTWTEFLKDRVGTYAIEAAGLAAIACFTWSKLREFKLRRTYGLHAYLAIVLISLCCQFVGNLYMYRDLRSDARERDRSNYEALCGDDQVHHHFKVLRDRCKKWNEEWGFTAPLSTQERESPVREE